MDRPEARLGRAALQPDNAQHTLCGVGACITVAGMGCLAVVVRVVREEVVPHD